MNLFKRSDPKEISRPSISLQNRLGSFKYAGGLFQMQVRAAPARQDAFEKVHKTLKADCELKKAKAVRARDRIIQDATDACSAAVHDADATFDRALHEAFLEHGKPPSVEEVALAQTQVDHVVQLAAPAAAPQAAQPAPG